MQTAKNDQLLKGHQVAALIGWTPETFSRHKKRLIASEGFPSPLPSRFYWRSAVLRWIETYGDNKTAAIAQAQGKSIASARVHEDRRTLTEKYVARNAA